MEKLIQAFGIDGRLIIGQIINFVILVAALSYFLYRPILKLLNDRQDKIKQAVKDADEAAVAKENANAERDKILTTANQDADAVIQRAKVHADEKGVEALKEAENKAVAVAREAEVKAAEIKKQARKDSEAEIARLAVLAAEKVLRGKSAS